ncbi:uncharacterized protein [Temnothorax nylanderi]|uniref:uncharacterized protein n=1 Tax=Temnothorax nylanderi TaxID=102681 RepID=UPI003A8BD3B4
MRLRGLRLKYYEHCGKQTFVECLLVSSQSIARSFPAETLIRECFDFTVVFSLPPYLVKGKKCSLISSCVSQTCVVSRIVMISVARHFRYHQILLLAIGLWPYQQSKLVQFQQMLFFGILLSLIMPQVHLNFWSFAVKRLMEELQHICDELEDENEIAIIKKYGNEAKRFTGIMIFSTFLVFCFGNAAVVASVISLAFIPGVVFINKSQIYHHVQNRWPVYYVNQEKYGYLPLLHICAVILIGGTVLTVTGMWLFAYIKHACGMFRIASYRIEKALMTNIMKMVSLNDEIIMYKEMIVSLKDEIIMYKEMILAVDIHRKAINRIIFQISTTFGDNIDCIIHLLTVGVIFVSIFILNYVGQEITDHNDHVFSTAYNVRWYMAPLHVQKLILFLLQRGSKTFNLHLGGILILSLECFATLTKASVSYFTFVYSTQE